MSASRDDRIIKIWEATTGELVRTIEGESSRITSLAVFSDGRIVCGDIKGLILIWSPPTEP